MKELVASKSITHFSVGLTDGTDWKCGHTLSIAGCMMMLCERGNVDITINSRRYSMTEGEMAFIVFDMVVVPVKVSDDFRARFISVDYDAAQDFTMDTDCVAQEIYRFTSGYPFLVSLICQWIDERLPKDISTDEYWTPWGVRAAVREILKHTNTLFDDMIKNLENYPVFRKFIEGILFEGIQVPYKRSNPEINMGVTFGIVGEEAGLCRITNIIFETYLYDHFITDKTIQKQVLLSSRAQFIRNDGLLDMDIVLEKFQGDPRKMRRSM